MSFSRDWLGFTGARDPEAATSGKKQRERIEDLAAACAAKIKSEVLPALRVRAAEILGANGWTIAIDVDDPQTMFFTYPSTNRFSSRRPGPNTTRRCPALSACCRLRIGLLRWRTITAQWRKCSSDVRARGRKSSIGCARWRPRSTPAPILERMNLQDPLLICHAFVRKWVFD